MRSRKIIKKLVQITVLLMALLFAVPATAFVLLQSEQIQNKVLDSFIKVISEKLETRCSISHISISFPYRIRLQNVYIQDRPEDTILFARTVTAGIRFIRPSLKEISIGSLHFDQAYLRLAVDSTNTLNLNYFLDKLKTGGGSKEGWKVSFNNIKLRKSRFSFKGYEQKPVATGMEYSNLRFSDIEGDIKRFNPSRDSLSFYIKSLSLSEHCGFIIENLTGNFSQSKKFLSLRKVEIKTPDSDLKGNEISLLFDGWSKFKADSFSNFVKLRMNFSESKFNFSDLAYFAPAFQNSQQQVMFSGQIRGPVSNLKGKNLEVSFGRNSRLSGEISLSGLPNVHETFILADINDLSTSAGDIRNFRLTENTRINLPSKIEQLGLITFNGNFTGFINDFVTYGRFSTNLGVINTDLLLRPDTSNYIDFEGKLTAENFDLHPLFTGSSDLGKISLSASVNGSTLAGNSIDAAMNVLVNKFEFRKYEYTNMVLAGHLLNKTFDGSIHVKDPNVELEFLGKVNLSDSIAAFDFTANVTDANFYALNLNKSDPDFNASFYLIANARGNSINSLNGEVKLLNSLFTKKEKQLQIYDFAIYAMNSGSKNRLQLRSDFVDADLTGQYELNKLDEALKDFLFAYLPSLSDSVPVKDTLWQNNFEFTATIKNARPFFDFFMPDYGIAENTILHLEYDTDIKTNLNLQSSWVKIKGLKWNDLNLDIKGDKSSLDLSAGGKSLTIGNRITLDNFTILSLAGEDSARLTLRWNNWQDVQYKGSVEALTRISRNPESRYPRIEVALSPTSIITNDTLWTIQPGYLTLDSTSIRFDNLAVNHDHEYFRFNGALTENPGDHLDLMFNEFNIANLNGITEPSGYKISGILNGNAAVSDIYTGTLFTSLLKIDSLVINDEILGNAEINSSWEDGRKAMKIEAGVIRDNLRAITIRGEYLPADQGKLDFTIELDKFRMNLFNPYVKTIFTDIRGMASGKAELTGTASKPLLNGEFNLQKTTFKINYLQTRYNFTDQVQIENNNIYFKDVRIFDEPRGNSAYLTGAIRNKYLKDFNLDLTIRSDEFLCMNTKETDNSLFYGTAYAKDLVLKMTGPLRKIVMDVTATTAPNTNINFPLSTEGKIDEYQFITIVNKEENLKDSPEKEDYEVDLSGLQINFDLTVTPDAEVQIIFDPKLGDKIRGRGNGNLDMKFNTDGSFLMYGDYTIEKGSYLFTLQSLINKDLTIESGGNIRWNGDPFDATIDIVAYYRTKASLSDLYGTGDEASSKIWVNDRITMTGRLTKPDVKYDIYLPDADESTRMSLNSAISSSEELNKQFIALLTLNRFVPSTMRTGQSQTSTTSPVYTSAAGVNASEFLSNQLSHWLSQINNDVDVNINYRSDRELKSDEVQVALSTQLFNDRLTIGGSVDVATNAAVSASDNIVGEFDLDYKITKNGKFRIKTYNHINNDLLYESSTYIQGLGFFYKEEFNTLGELLRRYRQSIFGIKEEEPGIVTEKANTGG